MTESLYQTNLRSIAGAELFKAMQEFTRIDSPIDSRPREGFLLDFKENLGDQRFLHTVASLANTFRGLVILGVSEHDGRPAGFVGIKTPGELKTQVASLLASNLFNCPEF
jgi:hypothetical protein